MVMSVEYRSKFVALHRNGEVTKIREKFFRRKTTKKTPISDMLHVDRIQLVYLNVPYRGMPTVAYHIVPLITSV